MSVGYQNGGNQRQPKAQQGSEGEDWDALKTDVSEMAGAAMERGRHFIDTAREQATGYMDRRKDDVAKSVADFAHSLRESCRSFDDRPNIRSFVDNAADGLDELAQSIRSRSLADLFNEAENYMRRRPTAVAAVTLATGFLLARFIKSSAAGMRPDSGRRPDRAGAGQFARGEQNAQPASHPQAGA